MMTLIYVDILNIANSIFNEQKLELRLKCAMEELFSCLDMLLMK